MTIVGRGERGCIIAEILPLHRLRPDLCTFMIRGGNSVHPIKWMVCFSPTGATREKLT